MNKNITTVITPRIKISLSQLIRDRIDSRLWRNYTPLPNICKLDKTFCGDKKGTSQRKPEKCLQNSLEYGIKWASSFDRGRINV
jgi:hypothetical protein